MATVQASVDAEVEKAAAAALKAEGLTVEEAVRLLLVRTAEAGELPFAREESHHLERNEGWDAEEIVARLKAYRERDPDFKIAMEAFVDAEVAYEDPLEGVPVRGRFIDGHFVEVGPVQRGVRELINA